MKRDHSRYRSQTGLTMLEQRRAGELRREREVGNWGRASEHVGRRWEELGFERLNSILTLRRPWPTDSYQPLALVPLMTDPAIQLALMRMGLPSPDVIVVLANARGGLVLQALDFKWDLEFASYDQIRASALRAVLERDQFALGAAITAAVGATWTVHAAIDGLLFAPDSPANDRFLSSIVNRQQAYPIEAREVILEPVDPELFFSPLPGWEMAKQLAAIDRSAHSLQTADGAERYYRLGTGLLGAVTQLRSSVFEADPVATDPSSAIAWLGGQVRAVTTGALVDHAERLMSVRAQQVARLRRLTKSPYRWADLAQVLASKGIVLPEPSADGEPPPERERWRDVIRRVGVEHRAAIIQTGLRLTTQGHSDTEALAQLELDAARFRTMAKTVGARLVAAVPAHSD